MKRERSERDTKQSALIVEPLTRHTGKMMNRFNLTAIAAALCLAASASAVGAAMSKPEYKTAGQDISNRYASDIAACKSMAGNAKDICTEEAKGREKVAKAELEANYAPSDKHSYDVRVAKADAAYAVAKEKCDDVAGNTKDVCLKEAKSAYVAAKADAKLADKTADANTTAREKTADARATAREKTADAQKDAATEKRDAAYAVAKEKCDALAGDAKASCLKDAKARYDQY